MLEWTEYLKLFVALLVIVDPAGAIPVFVGLTSHLEPPDRRRTAHVAALAAAAVLISACLIGEAVLQLFGIRIASFQVGGGIVLLLMATAMIHARQTTAKQTPEEAQEAESRDSIAVVPIAVPLLSGPGAISLMVISVHETQGWTHKAILIGGCLGVAVLVWLTLLLASPISQALGKTGLNIAKRLMGLLLAAIAVEFICTGVAELLPGLT